MSDTSLNSLVTYANGDVAGGITRPVSGDNAEMSVRGTKAVSRDARPAASVPGPATSKMVTSIADRARRRPKKSPVRNWNVKDDVVLR